MIAQTKNSVEIEWKMAATLPASVGNDKPIGQAGLLAGIHNDVMILAGGANFPDKVPWLGGKKRYYSDVFVFEKGRSGTISVMEKSFRLPFATAYGAGCNSPHGIVYAGGENESGILDKVILVQWDAKRKGIVISGLPSLPFPVTNAASVYHDRKVYVAGGETTGGSVSKKFLCLDMVDTSAGWKQLTDLPQPVSHTVMVVQSNGDRDQFFIIGGRKRNNNGISDLYRTVYSYDLVYKQWQEKSSLPDALSAGTGVAAGKQYILIFGGDKGETFHKAEKLIAAISTESDPQRREELNKGKIIVQSMHPGFSKEILLYDTIKDEWTSAGYIPFDVPATTTALKWDDLFIIPSGEIKAGIRTPGILSGKQVTNYKLQTTNYKPHLP